MLNIILHEPEIPANTEILEEPVLPPEQDFI